MRRSSSSVSTFLVLALTASAVWAQGPTRLEFSFSNPGARSMGFGGAFIGLADDATAAYANPAGLTQLVRPEVSIEGRTWSYETPFTVAGRASGQPTGLGIDTTAGLLFGVSTEDSTGISFLSIVYPLQRWSLAVYRHQLASFEATFSTNGLFAESSTGGTMRLADFRGSSELDHVAYGLSAACQLSEAFSLGLGLSWVDGGGLILQEEFLQDDDTLEAFFAPNSYLPERSIGSTELVIDSTDWTLSAGFLWRVSRHLSLGGVVRQGPDFATDAIARAGPAFDPEVPVGSELRVPTTLESPDVFGLGLAVRARGDALTLSFDWVRVEYSDLLEGLDPVEFDDLPVVDDADELHAGLEYVFLQTSPLLALRAGVWLDPDHRLRAAPGETEPFDLALFPRGDDELHFAAGLGLAVQRFQLDLGIDLSEPVDTISLSAIYRF